MSINVSSLTCYALLSAVESDLRNLIAAHCEETESEQVLGIELLERGIQRRTKERRQSTSTNLSSLLPYIDFEDAYNVLRRMKGRLPGELNEGLKALEAKFKALTPIRNRVAHSRPLEMDDVPFIVDFSAEIVECPGYQWNETVDVRAELERNPGFVLVLTPDLIADDPHSIPHNLPPADFDETGFMGRRDQRRELVKALKGPWPVVSILGDGGLGKTALALQVAYDLLDDETCPFDAVVWTSAKNATLTTSEIVKIEGAIQDSLGLFVGAANELAGDVRSEDAIAEVLEYLSFFRILLILDNLETVIDDNIREFLKNLPHGSKVFITSRIGVGTENPFKLAPLSVSEAKHLVRTLARVRNIQTLVGMHDAELEKFVLRMNCHPGFIKWFVSGVQAGQAPEKLVEENGLVLKFCMDNVFQYLGDDAKATLRSMLVLPGVHTLAELAFLNEFPASQIQGAVLELTTTNFLSQVRGGASGTGYSLSDFAKSYLQKTHPVEPDERQWLLERYHSLYRFGGVLQEAHSLNPYSPETIDIRSAGDFHAAQSLRAALELAARRQFDEAIGQCQEAAELAPGYPEVYRIQGYIYESSLSFTEAYDAYDRAKDLADASAFVRYFFGRFLVTSGYNPNQGLTELQRAARLDPESREIKLAVAEAHIQVGNIDDALGVAAAIIGESPAGEPQSYDALRVALGAVYKGGEIARANFDWARIAELVESLLGCLLAVPLEGLSIYDLDTLMQLGDVCALGASKSSDEYVARRCRGFADDLLSARREASPTHVNRKIGYVNYVNPEKGFAFAGANHEDFFIHASQLLHRELFDSLPHGAAVAFTPGEASQGQKAPALRVNCLA